MKQLPLYLLLTFAVLHHGVAQQLQITTYSPREGVPVYGVNSIFQDSKGWIWLTSGYEVMRYDGHRFRTYHPVARAQMDFCFKVLEVKGEIWVLAAPHTLKVSGDSLQQVDLINAAGIYNYLQHEAHSYFLCKDGIYQVADRRLKPFITASLTGNLPESMVLFNDSLVVSHQRGERLLVFDIKNKLFHSLALPVTDISKDQEGNILLLLKGTGIVRVKQISRAANGLNVITDPVFLFTETKYGQLVVDGQGNYWMYKQFQELVKLGAGNDKRAYNESHGLPSLWFNQMFIDREKNLWIAFNSGLCKIRNTNWERYTMGESLYSNHILFCTKGPGTEQVFVGTQNGVNVFDKGKMKQVSHLHQPFRCNTLVSSGSTQYYSRDSILFSAFIDTATFTVKAEKMLANLRTTVIQLAVDPPGNLFIATTNGIFAYANQQLTRIIADTSYFRRIMLDSDSRLWAGEFAGKLHCYRLRQNTTGLQLQEIFSLDSVSSSMPRLTGIRSMAETKQGDIIIGTRFNGLFVLELRNDKVISTKHYGVKNGLSGNTVWDFAVDTAGICWIATMQGLNRMQKQDDHWKVSDESIKRQLYQATLLFADPENNIWVANHPGIVMVRNDPDLAVKSFSVSITGITVNGEPVSSDPAINAGRLSHSENNVIIEFSANTYRYEEAVLYSFRLNDNDEWTTPAAAHQVYYSALRPGKYRFSVKALNTDGQWSTNEAFFGFEIMPPFWQRSWFIVLVIAAIAAGLYALYRYRVNRIRELFEMRNVIASDLHDEIGSTLTSINILSKVSHTHLQNDQEKASSLLKKVIDQSQQIQENMSDIVWSIRPDNDKMENIVLRMREYLNHTLEPKNIPVDFVADDKILKESLTMQQRRDFFLVFKEAINNIAKYASCSKVEIRLGVEDGKIRLLIRDDGRGFDPGKISTSNGLRNMQHRAALLKGGIEIRSAAGMGTSIELLLPATQ